jgi:hypothetical protein
MVMLASSNTPASDTFFGKTPLGTTDVTLLPATSKCTCLIVQQTGIVHMEMSLEG